MPINSNTLAYKNNYLYTKGGQFTLDGKNYIGEYHLERTTPKTGPLPSQESKTLYRVYPNQDHFIYDKYFNFNIPILTYTNPKPYLYAPLEQNYKSPGIDTRYFVEKIEDSFSYAIEINKRQYDLIGKPGGIDPGLYMSVAIRWKLTGKESDIISFNQNELYVASTVVPSIAYAVKNYLEFARVTLV